MQLVKLSFLHSVFQSHTHCSVLEVVGEIFSDGSICKTMRHGSPSGDMTFGDFCCLVLAASHMILSDVGVCVLSAWFYFIRDLSSDRWWKLASLAT